MLTYIAVISVLLGVAPAAAQTDVLPTGPERNKFYGGNREPLLPNPLTKLPLTSIRPEGWLRRQLELMAKGFTGHLTELSQFCKFQGNGWTSPDGEGQFGWEEVPYWLRGYLDLGYVLQDAEIMRQANRWVDGVISTGQPSGYFGSRSNLEFGRNAFNRMLDVWPNMVMLFPLRSLYEATGDPRILPFMTKYFQWQMTVPLEDFLSASWQKTRGGDNLDSIYWLYNRTGDRFLLDAARVTHERTQDWTGGIASWHNVNFAECFREPGQYYQQTRDLRYLKAAERNYDSMRKLYGEVPGGMWGGDENSRPGFSGPRQGIETCAMVEMMYSGELLASITGDVKWADRVEDVAFNSLPASMTADLRGLHYLTAPNQIQLDRKNKSPMIQNGGDQFSYNPHQYRCCQHNVAFGWPYFSEHLWMATRHEGLAAVFYAPSKVKAKVGDGTEVTVTETTDYPFSDTVVLKISAPKTVRFPLSMRIPEWCDVPEVSVNGERAAVARSGWAIVNRDWASGDEVRLRLPMHFAVQRGYRDTASVSRGPLTYALKIRERWQRAEGTAEWPGWEAYPDSPWNYGLVLDSFKVPIATQPIKPQPFTLDGAPLQIEAKGRRIPQWKQEPNGLIGEVQPGPVRSDQPLETITLIPMGCARLRISAFPVIDEGGKARVWQDASPIVFASAAGHYDGLAAVNDGRVPSGPGDSSVPRFRWPASPNQVEWIEYRWAAAQKLASSEVWFAIAPASWSLEWLDGQTWKPVAGVSAYPLAMDGFNRVRFPPVSTTALRLQVGLEPRQRAAIYEWRVGN